MQFYVKILIVDMMFKKKNKFFFVIYYLDKFFGDFYRDFYILFFISCFECYFFQIFVNYYSEIENLRGFYCNFGVCLIFVLFYKLFLEIESLCLMDYQVYVGFGLKYYL